MPLVRHSFPTRRSSDLISLPTFTISSDILSTLLLFASLTIYLKHEFLESPRRSKQYKKCRMTSFSFLDLITDGTFSFGFLHERSEEHTSELQSRQYLVCLLFVTLSLHDALPILFPCLHLQSLLTFYLHSCYLPH